MGELTEKVYGNTLKLRCLEELWRKADQSNDKAALAKSPEDHIKTPGAVAEGWVPPTRGRVVIREANGVVGAERETISMLILYLKLFFRKNAPVGYGP